MSRIGVGINENVVLSKASFNDKGKLTLGFRYVRTGEEEEKEEDPFASMNAAEVIEDAPANLITIWGPKVPDAVNRTDNSTRTDKERAELANDDIKKIKNQLQQILEQYMPVDSIKWDIFAATGMTKETYFSDLLSQNVLDQIYKNLGEQFIEMISPYLDKDELAVRFKLRRQSKDKHYATIPDRYLKESPFIEPMAVPKEKSRVKWSEYEKKNGLDSGERTITNADTDPVEDTDTEDVNVFGTR